MIDVTRFSPTNDWMNKKFQLRIIKSLEGEFKVGTMHGIPGLKCDNLIPSSRFKHSACLGWRFSNIFVIIRWGELDSTKFASNISVMDLTHEVIDCRMLWISAKNFASFIFLGRLPNVIDVDD